MIDKKDKSPEESKEKDKSPNMLSEEGMIASYKSPLFMANLMVFKNDQMNKQERSNNGDASEPRLSSGKEHKLGRSDGRKSNSSEKAENLLKPQGNW